MLSTLASILTPMSLLVASPRRRPRSVHETRYPRPAGRSLKPKILLVARNQDFPFPGT